jgi:HK97 family phage portal protein
VTLLAPIFAGSVEDPETPLGLDSLDSLFAGQPTASGQRVTEEKSLGISTVWRAVNLIASSVASLPLHAYKSQEGARVKAGGRAAKLLADPHPDMTPFDLWEIVGAHLLLWGNAYLLLRGTPQDPIAEMWPIHPGRVKVGRLGGPTSMGKKIYVIDGSKVYTDDDILHIPGFGYDGICGVSPIRAARQGIGLALAAEEFGATLFGSNSLATGVLQTEQRLTPEQAQQLQARWTARRASLGPYDPIVLGGGLKFDQLSIPPADAQFLQSREFQVAEVARMFGIPPHMLMSTEKTTSWGSGIEQMSIGYVVYTLRFILTRIEQRLSRVLRPQAVYARFSVEGLLRGDSAQRSAFYRTMWELGALSTNEIRELEERPPVEGGDVRFRPLNFGELDAAGVAVDEGVSSE